MSDNLELESVIEDAVNDATNPEPVEVETSVETVAETPTEEAAVEAPVEEASTVDDISGNKTEPEVEADPFAKKFGLQSQSVTGRENRIPYSRVKKIVEKNERDTVARVTAELTAKQAPKVTELETKIADYDTRWEKVAQFENILENDQKTFLTMLSQHPKYAEFFQYVEKAVAALETQGTPQAAVVDPSGGMPEPDQIATDGQKYYSRDGLQKLMEWHSSQVEQRTIKQVEERYRPIEQEWQSREQMAKIVPQVERQIAEARTWDKFPELEPKVVELLKADKNLSLERAYVKAYQEASVAERDKLSTDRNQIRTEVLAELRKKPISSNTPTAPVKPTRQEPVGERNLEDVIRESLVEAGLK